MKSGELKRAKKVVRARVRDLRDAIPAEERAALGLRVTENVLVLPELERARTVMVFWAFGSEVPTADLIERLHGRGITVALPTIVGGELEARTFAPGDPVTTAWFGAKEPAHGEPLAPGAIDVILVPGVAFDRAGRRVGYGGGYYDRFLGSVRPGALRAGICFAVQLVGGDLPAGAFDQGVDVIVTESAVVRVGVR